jgi:proteasome lid subunit RPN8/RPN11
MKPSVKIKRLILDKALGNSILVVAQKYPLLEVAGVLIGYFIYNVVHAEKVIFDEPANWKEDSFKFNQNLLDTKYRKPAEDKYSSVAIFHQHVHGTLFPSFTDLRAMILTNLPWLIFRVTNCKVILRGFVFEEGIIRKVPVTLSQR